jgi:membrane protein implicated in regulation of membrane protease activity
VDTIIETPAVIFLIVGLVLFGMDIFVIGLSPLLFVAAGALVTSAIVFVAGWGGGILHLAGWTLGYLEAGAIWAILSVLIALVGRGRLEAFQSAGIEDDRSSDLIGREMVTTEEITKTAGWISFSGTTWQARLADSVDTDRIGPGVRMRVVQVKNLALVLRPVS